MKKTVKNTKTTKTAKQTIKQVKKKLPEGVLDVHVRLSAKAKKRLEAIKKRAERKGVIVTYRDIFETLIENVDLDVEILK